MWKTVYHYFSKWRLDGTRGRIHLMVRERLRVRLGCHPQPRAGIIDSQSVKTTSVGGVRGKGKDWIEWTLGWHARARWLDEDNEVLCSTSQAMIYVCMIRLMLRRLTRR